MDDLDRVRTLIADHPTMNRSALSRQVCEMFHWLKPDGQLKEMSCHVVMLKMHREGLIALPAPTRLSPKPYQLVLTHAQPIKSIWLKPLSPDFKQTLSECLV